MTPEINYWIWSCIHLSKQHHPGLKVIQMSTSIIWSLNIVFSYVICHMSVDIGRTRNRTFTESSPPLVRAYLLKTKATGTKTKISERNRIQKINKISISRNRLRIFSWNVNSANKFSLETFYHSQEWNLKHLHLRKPQFSTTITNYWPRFSWKKLAPSYLNQLH